MEGYVAGRNKKIKGKKTQSDDSIWLIMLWGEIV